MMSEREVDIEVTARIGWTEWFEAGKALLDATHSTDVRWVHVERINALAARMRELFEAKRFGVDTESVIEAARKEGE